MEKFRVYGKVPRRRAECNEFRGLVGILFPGCICGNAGRLNSIGRLLEAFRQAAQFLGQEWIGTSRGASAAV
jgi:hypothetical protein